MWVARWELPKRPKQQWQCVTRAGACKALVFWTETAQDLTCGQTFLKQSSHYYVRAISFQATSGALQVYCCCCTTSVGAILCTGGKQFEKTMAGRTWKISAVVAVSLALFAISEFRVAEAQGPVNECAIGTARCAPHAFCRDTVIAYRCFCRAGYYGDGYLGAGYSGCTRRRLSTWRIATSIIGSILGALLIFCLCLVCLRNIFRRRRGTDYPVQQGGPAYGYPQQSYPPQQGVPMYPTHNQKVPEPAGVV